MRIHPPRQSVLRFPEPEPGLRVRIKSKNEAKKENGEKLKKIKMDTIERYFLCLLIKQKNETARFKYEAILYHLSLAAC